MGETFSKQVQVLEPECDLNQQITLSSLMRHSQQMGSDHLARQGLDYNRLRADGMVFLVAKLRIDILRRPCFGERLAITTVPRQPKGAQFIRDTYFDTFVGERLAQVSIAWTLIDPNTRKILRPSVFDRYGFQMSPNDGESITGYRIHRPAGDEISHMRQAKYSDLDYNLHVNNAVYADIICDCMPLDWMFRREIRTFGILYRHEITANQAIEMAVVQEADRFYTAGEVAGKRCFEAELVFADKIK